MRFLVGIILQVFALTCLAQWTPVIAHQRTIEETLDKEGKVISSVETKSLYYRASDGSVLQQYFAPDSGLISKGQLIDYGKTHKLYALNYDSKTALAKRDLPALRQPPPVSSLNRSTVMGEEVVYGIHCLIQPIIAEFKGQSSVIGKFWVSPENGFLIVKEESMDAIPDGVMRHRIRELYDITVGQEPDPALFEVASRFEIQGKSGAAPPACKAASPDSMPR